MIGRRVKEMVSCPACHQEVYWVIVKGKVFAIPFSYRDIQSEKAELLKYNEIKEVCCPKCFSKLNISSFEDLVEFLSQ